MTTWDRRAVLFTAATVEADLMVAPHWVRVFGGEPPAAILAGSGHIVSRLAVPTLWLAGRARVVNSDAPLVGELVVERSLLDLDGARTEVYVAKRALMPAGALLNGQVLQRPGRLALSGGRGRKSLPSGRNTPWLRCQTVRTGGTASLFQ